MKKTMMSIAVAIFLVGCTTAPPVSQAPDMTFDHFAPIMLDVAKIEIYDEYKPPMASPNVEHLFPTPPYAAARTLVEKSLTAAGNDNILRVIIEDASIIEERLPTTQGVWGAFTREPSEHYRARVSLRFELVSERAPDIVIGHATVIGKRNKTILEDISPAERDRAYFNLTEELMNDVGDGLVTIVRNTFGTKS